MLQLLLHPVLYINHVVQCLPLYAVPSCSFSTIASSGTIAMSHHGAGPVLAHSRFLINHLESLVDCYISIIVIKYKVKIQI